MTEISKNCRFLGNISDGGIIPITATLEDSKTSKSYVENEDTPLEFIVETKNLVIQKTAAAATGYYYAIDNWSYAAGELDSDENTKEPIPAAVYEVKSTTVISNETTQLLFEYTKPGETPLPDDPEEVDESTEGPKKTVRHSVGSTPGTGDPNNILANNILLILSSMVILCCVWRSRKRHVYF